MTPKIFSLILIVFCTLAACKPATKTTLPAGDSSMNSVDWPGDYYGVLPCADCEGIETQLQLKIDKTYTLRTRYLGKEQAVQVSTGHFTWNTEGSKITLSKQNPGMYQVGENQLFHLDQSGNRISGNLADNYILRKSMGGLTEKYWKLTEIYGKPVTVSATMKKEPHMILHTAENRINGTGGCNNFMGTYELKGMDRISFGKLAGTMMACPDMEVENNFMKALGEADSYTINGDKLVLNRARMAPLARFEAVYLK